MFPSALLLLLLSISVVFPSTNVLASDAQCRKWQIVDKPQPGDYAILLSSFYIKRLEETDPGADYEMWGYVEVKHGNWIMGKTYFGTPDSHKVCKISDLGGPKNYASTIAAAAVTAGLAVATGGSSVLVQGAVGAVGGFAVLFAEDQLTGTKTCPDGLMGAVSYPVSYRTNTLPYNFRAEIVEDDSWHRPMSTTTSTRNSAIGVRLTSAGA